MSALEEEMERAKAQCRDISVLRDASIERESRIATLLHLEFESITALLDSSRKSLSGLADLRAETMVKAEDSVDVHVSEILELGRSIAAFSTSKGSTLRDANVFDLEGDRRSGKGTRELTFGSLRLKVAKLRAAAHQLAHKLHVNATGFASDRQSLVYAVETREEVQTRLRLATSQIGELEAKLKEIRETSDSRGESCIRHFKAVRELVLDMTGRRDRVACLSSGAWEEGGASPFQLKS